MEMTFAEAIESLIIGRRLKRLEWPDDGTYIVMANERLSIFKPEDKMVHPLIVSLGDMMGEDWVVITEQKPELLEIKKGKLIVSPEVTLGKQTEEKKENSIH
uniref:Thoeris anti-defense 2-like domain-containing protein n=1 Tax=viral metagenome TaxID=1070528 RepID=A0A6M3IMV9_9ZZZZ